MTYALWRLNPAECQARPPIYFCVYTAAIMEVSIVKQKLNTALLVIGATTLIGSANALADDHECPVSTEESAERGPPAGGGKKEKTEENTDLISRMGTTSIQMGTVEVPDTSASCTTEPGMTRLLCLTDLLKSSASDELLSVMQLDYSLAEGQNWSNLPAGAFPARPGAFLGEFTAEQLGLVKAILMEATSQTDSEGFDEMEQTLNADDYIGTLSDDDKAGYSSYNSKFAFLGVPADTGTWQLY